MPDHGEEKREITVTVFSPRSPDPKTFTWLKTMKVGDAAREAATAFGYQGGTPSLQKDGHLLDSSKPLVAAGVDNGDRLELVDTGGGV
jgi:hypothetical protein